MSKRGNGQGSVEKLPDGRFRGVVSLGYVNGKRKKKKGTRVATKGEARAWVARTLSALENGIEPGDDRVTVRRFLERWLTECVEGPSSSLRTATVVSYANLVRRHIIPGIGHVPLRRLSALQVQAFLNAKSVEKTRRVFRKKDKTGTHVERVVEGETMSPQTVRYIRAVLRRALSQAVRWNLVVRNVATLVDPPRTNTKEAGYMPPEEAMRFLDAVRGDRLRCAFTVAVAMGLRRGEIVGLRWASIELDAGILRVREQLQRVKGKGLVVSEPKSERSKRVLRMPSSLVDELRAHKRRQSAERLAAGPAWQDNGYVFTTSEGGLLDGRSLLRAWHTALVDAELTSRRFQESRHTAASLLLAQGVPLRVVQEILGHSSINLTANTYAHVAPVLHDDAAQKMDAMLRGQR